MTSSIQPGQGSRNVHPDRQLYIPPRRQDNVAGKASNAKIKDEGHPQRQHPTQEKHREPKAGHPQGLHPMQAKHPEPKAGHPQGLYPKQEKHREPKAGHPQGLHPTQEKRHEPKAGHHPRGKLPSGGTVDGNDKAKSTKQESDNKARNLQYWKMRRAQTKAKKVQKRQKKEGLALSVSEKRDGTSSVKHPIYPDSTTPSNHSYKGQDHPSIHQPKGGKMAPDNHGYSRGGEQGTPPHAFSKSTGNRTAEKPKPDIPRFLKENQAVANRAMLPAHHEGRVTQPKTEQSRTAAWSSVPRISSPLNNPSHAPGPSKPAPADSAQKLRNKPNDFPRGAQLNMSAFQPVVLEPPKAVGNWNTADTWTKPSDIKMPAPDSNYDIDFRSRPPSNMVIKVAHTVIDKNGKQVVQRSINPANRQDFPDLPGRGPKEASTPRLQIEIPDSSRAHEHAIVKADEQPKTVKSPIKAKAPAVQLTSSGTTEDKQSKSSTPEAKGILRYFRPVATSHSPGPTDKKPDTSLGSRLPSAVAQLEQPSGIGPAPISRPAEGRLVTDGSAFLLQALSAHKKMTSDNPQASSGPKKESLGNTSGSPVMDEVIANINAKSIASPTSADPNSSVKSVRGRADDKRSMLSASLNFEDTFKGRNPSVASQKSVVVYQGRQANNPYQTGDQTLEYIPKDFEPGQLRAWDGNWAPAPVEWDLRDMFDYKKAQHRESIKNFVLDRYKAFKKGLCPALLVQDCEAFTTGASLALGYSHFGKPINDVHHHHIRATDPFTLNKLHQTAKIAIENYCRVHKTKIQEQEQKRKAKKLSKEERDKMEADIQEQMRNMPPNPFTPVANIYIRPARLKDLAQIRAIYNHYTRTSAVTQERVELNDREIRSRFDDCATEQYPFIVAISRHGRTAEKDEVVVGFAFAEDYGGEGTMWRHTCEAQFFVHARHVRKGIGKNLLDTLFRGMTPYYHYHNGCRFMYTDEEFPRHDGGGARIVSNVLIPFAYFVDEEDQHAWLGHWLAREFNFEHQGTLKGIGHAGIDDKP
ncbi:MAG: hypothetical protein LQ346_001359 [Caloplaca aetnensis]|nr:MAG: hypothetical protein LQ346_001359 [Caloplaca aetnensis]